MSAHQGVLNRGGSELGERTIARPVLWLGVFAYLVAFTGGCADRPRGGDNQRFVPAADAARDAVVLVLEEWKTGTPRNQNRGDLPQVQLVDNHRPPGRRIESYKLLGQTAFEGGRRLHVQVTWFDPPQVERIRFVVVGIDPLWVFRQEDYDLIAHWDHAMPQANLPPEGEPEP